MRITDLRYRASSLSGSCGAAAIADTSQGPTDTPLIFKVLADGRELWHSPPMQQTGTMEPFDLDVAGIDELQLQVECPAGSGFCHAVWVDPILDPR